MSSLIAFAGSRRIAEGSLVQVAMAARSALESGARDPLLIFDAQTSAPVELDLRGSEADVRARLGGGAPVDRGPGRPRLGVVAREVTLLPRHWEWLSRQPGGASAALRRLVEDARRLGAAAEDIRQARESLYRFAAATAGNAPGFEEAMRALFGGDAARFREAIDKWPPDVQAHALTLAAAAFEEEP